MTSEPIKQLRRNPHSLKFLWVIKSKQNPLSQSIYPESFCQLVSSATAGQTIKFTPVVSLFLRNTCLVHHYIQLYMPYCSISTVANHLSLLSCQLPLCWMSFLWRQYEWLSRSLIQLGIWPTAIMQQRLPIWHCRAHLQINCTQRETPNRCAFIYNRSWQPTWIA